MVATLKLADITVEVVRKDIKNVHLSVYPPFGRVRVAAPHHMKLDTIRVFLVAKLSWIKAQQHKLASQARETALAYIERESHYVWGRRYLLNVVEGSGPQGVALRSNRMVLTVRPGTNVEQRAAVVAGWRRQLLRNEAQQFIAAWEERLGVTTNRLLIQSMKTMWGGCNPKTRNIRINTELSKKPKQCLDYVILHEIAHLLVPNHGPEFQCLLDQHLPHWRSIRRQLNELPLADLTRLGPTSAPRRAA